jgi:alcohol dehydrogenase (cytochrome c)
MVESCMDVSVQPSQSDAARGGVVWALKEPPNSDGKFGRVAAIDLHTRRIVWTKRRRAPSASATLATAGGVLFEGSSDRQFHALDSLTGATLWETSLNATPNGFPISFAVDNTQYIEIIAGGGTPFDLLFGILTPEIPNSNGARTIWVFKVGAP